ncbi:tRNA (adenosine(37)-N6)-threonylcarbamoyltransferase complex ATPase subunit type 1 TsaE [Patescibacteria group bacterium]|nr:tRNA (adenosine(37)-N6)-threonylcarbamoyltransferase complex ATPase subunit type 1 TsaE [Patescibacteria group bacterium]
MSKHITTSEKQTIALGKKIASGLKDGEVLALTGDLGAGKTTLIKGIAQGLGIKKIITSPTFVLMKVYQVNSPKASRRGVIYIRQFVHIDCYRTKSPQEIVDIGADEYFGDKNTVVVIEWAEKIKKILPRQTKKILLELGNNQNTRIINIT